MFNANHSFSATGNLLLFLDRAAKRPLTGALESSTLAPQPPLSVVEGGSFDAAGNGHGTIDTTSRRSFAVSGYVRTSHGTIRTRVENAIAFTQHQDVTNSATSFVQNITQRTLIASHSTSRRVEGDGEDGGRGENGDRGDGGRGDTSASAAFDWPLTLNFSYTVNPDGSSAQTTAIKQGYIAKVEREGRRGREFESALSNVVAPTDTLNFDPSGALVSSTNNASSQTYTYRDSTGVCYGRKVTAANRVVTGNAATGC